MIHTLAYVLIFHRPLGPGQLPCRTATCAACGASPGDRQKRCYAQRPPVRIRTSGGLSWHSLLRLASRQRATSPRLFEAIYKWSKALPAGTEFGKQARQTEHRLRCPAE